MTEKNCNNCGNPCMERGTSKTIYCESWIPKVQEQTGKGYLDKEAVLKAFKQEPLTFYDRCLHGEFDADGSIPGLPMFPLHEKMLAEKDAEIARLKYQITGYHEAIEVLRESKDREISDIKKERNGAVHRIAHQDQEIEKLRALLHDTETAAMKNTGRLEDRIAQQDQELKDLGEALRYKCQMREAAEQREPELFICDHAEKCDIGICNHIRPHKHLDGCDKPTCDSKSDMPVKCIPYKKEPTVPQQQSEFGPDFESSSLPRMTKDIGDLTLRLDKCEQESSAILKKAIILEDRLNNLEESRDTHYKALVGQTDYAIESRKRIETTESALKSLKEEIAANQKIIYVVS